MTKTNGIQGDDTPEEAVERYVAAFTTVFERTVLAKIDESIHDGELDAEIAAELESYLEASKIEVSNIEVLDALIHSHD